MEQNILEKQRDLNDRLNRYRDEYYNRNAPSVSDEVYDRLFDELKELEQETGIQMANSPTQTVGYPAVSRLEKTRHEIPLLSLDKTKSSMPLILIFGQIRGAYLGGSILAFFLGYSMMFFKGGILASIYPFSAALILVGFDMSEYAGTTTAPNPLLAVIGVGIMVLWAVLLLVMSSNKKEMKARKQTKAKGRGKRAVRRKGR